MLTTCPRCRTTVEVPQELMGQAVCCPQCSEPLLRAEEIPTVRPVTGITREPLRDRLCPYCGNRVSSTAERCRHCREMLPTNRPGAVRNFVDYKPCPKCGSGGARRVVWTIWGSFYGPALFSHVRCPKCRYAYNGRSGRSNTLVAIIFVIVPAVLIFLILAGLVYVLLGYGGQGRMLGD